jgi:CubicO group peptidase (beta-lactamase class C family)
MRSGTVLLGSLAAVLGLGACEPAEESATTGTLQVRQWPSAPELTGIEQLVDAAMAAGMKEAHIPGAAIIVVRNGEVVFAKGYGKADVASDRPFSPDETIFPIASVSKLFTATAVMQLVDTGEVDLAADVNRHLETAKVPPTYPEPVIVAQLLSHTSGLDELPGRRVRSASELMPLGKFLSQRLVRVHPPGEMTSYSSYGMSLAGLIVEEVSDTPFEDYLRRHIWQPLQMSDTSITVPGDTSRLATAYELDGDKPVPIPYEIYQTPPAASVLSTADDMGRFMIAHLDGGRFGDRRILGEAATWRMQRREATMHPKLPGWTLGFQEGDLNGLRILEHGGDIGGFSTLLTLLPEHDVGFFIVHHLESNNLRFDVRQAILDRYFPDTREQPAPVPDPKKAESLKRFAGTYRANIFCHSCSSEQPVQDFEVEANADGTITVWGDRWVETSPLYFVAAGGKGRIGFAEDKDGRITAMSAGSWKVVEKID